MSHTYRQQFLICKLVSFDSASVSWQNFLYLYCAKVWVWMCFIKNNPDFTTICERTKYLAQRRANIPEANFLLMLSIYFFTTNVDLRLSQVTWISELLFSYFLWSKELISDWKPININSVFATLRLYVLLINLSCVTGPDMNKDSMNKFITISSIVYAYKNTNTAISIFKCLKIFLTVKLMKFGINIQTTKTSKSIH